MGIIELSKFLTKELGNPVYPLQFPYNTTIDNCYVLDIVQGSNGVISTLNIQLMTRSVEPSYGNELLSYAIEKLHQLTNKFWGEYQIVLILADNTNPYFIGMSDDNKFLYNTQLRVLVSKN